LTEKALRRENRELRQAVETRYRFGQLLGTSAVMQRLFGLLERLAATSSTVLIQGESGTGKELVARALHYHSARRRQPFVPVNCAALPESLLESELFGHVKGAFTGAQVARRGLVQEAAGGTLFLDEIGDMPLGMQAKLLRVLEQRQVRPVGSDREVAVDVRVVAATHQDLEEAVQQGTFRADLYYRLRVLLVEVPPLRAHREDIALLAEAFLQQAVAANQLEPRRFTPAALRALEQAAWPGNVRQLAHVVERAVTLSQGPEITVEELGLEAEPQPALPSPAWETAGLPPGMGFNLEAMTQHLLQQALAHTRGHKGQAADLLGVHPRTLTRMMRRFGLPED
jgi:DNA-binding NtrC family response regulator